MADIVPKEVRSRMMAGIGGRNTRPELQVRKGLHAAGFRYRLHDRGLPGRPDIVLPKYRAAIFVHGCFWHGHGCHLFRLPSSNTPFWRHKINTNIERDKRAVVSLGEAGWKVATVWECALKGRTRIGAGEVTAQLAAWLKSGENLIEIAGAVT